MTRPLDVLLIERGHGSGAAAARALGAAGHRVHRCSREAAGGPCRGVVDVDDCPVEHVADVALVVPLPGPADVPVEQSTSCVVRAGVPVVELGHDSALDPFAPYLAARLDADADVVGAAESAAAVAFRDMERAVGVMIEPLLRDLGVDPGGVGCTIERHGDQLRVRLDVPVALAEADKQALSVRALAALRDRRRRHTSVSVGVDCPA